VINNDQNSFEQLISKIASTNTLKDGDYLDDEDFLICGKCHTRKQCEVNFLEKLSKKPCLCKCAQAERNAEQRQREQEIFEQRVYNLRREGITDQLYLQSTFANDDWRDEKISRLCRKYVDQWESMRQGNHGILFYGSVGTGKTFLAACIANAVIDKGISAKVTSFPRILNELQNSTGIDRQRIIDSLNRYELLVIDDLGAERDTGYSIEQMYNVVDTRYRSGKPLIVTTNLSSEDLSTAPLQYKRIYDRINEMCVIPLKMAGESRRAQQANANREAARQILAVAGSTEVS